ncbi:MAG: phosphate ABC transporter ATP-binding protein PstB [Bifidobacteriaceae bacterium]|nr:phosphate ABC transporter ATP-binding protein PstB [Bifidobacteriaceae bacterium]MCI1978181.1 phosphate ABC transporter ATP-binding protein PstB [Bifidobacteriaceae bacterium]
MNENELTIRNLNAYYGGFQAISNVNMNIPAKEVTAFIGPSGCGKSTFLRTLNRMHEEIEGARVEGSIELEGQDLYAHALNPAAVRRHIGMVFQHPNPFPSMSIRDNVLSGLRFNSISCKGEAGDDIVEWALRSANLWDEVKDRLNKPGVGLSGGQQQRLCIARAIALKPEVLLMDEPCSALDPISTRAIEDLILELKQSYTIVIVTHNMQQAARISQKTAFFNLTAVGEPGHLVEMGDTEAMFSHPNMPQTKSYISGQFG